MDQILIVICVCLGDHKASMNRQDSMADRNICSKKDPQQLYQN